MVLSMRIVATIEARMSSTRLPGKVLLPLAGDRCVLDILVERLRAARYVDEIVLATTVNRADDALAAHAATRGWACYRGDEDDVMGRVLEAARSVHADLICEALGDSPLVDPLLLDHAITRHRASGADYTANIIPERTFPVGQAVQVFSPAVLERAYRATTDPVDRSHVSYYIYQHPREFVLEGMVAPPEVRAPDLRMCIDTREDYDVVRHVCSAFDVRGGDPGVLDMVRWLRSHPDVAALNRSVRMKRPEEK